MTAPLDPRRADGIRFVPLPGPRDARDARLCRIVWRVIGTSYCLWFWWIVWRVAEAWFAGRFPH